MRLQDALRETLQDWREDLPEAWQPVLADVEPDFDAVDPDLEHPPWEPILPRRKGRLLPGAPSKSHIFRALDGSDPARIRAVIIGQDPYPQISRATGRAFEQGDLEQWTREPGIVSLSLRRIVQAVGSSGEGSQYTHGNDAWDRLVQDQEELGLASPNKMFDQWQRQGVLCMNAGLTLSRFVRGGGPHQTDGHIPLWRPVVSAILNHLAARATGHVVYMLWGGYARQVYRDAGVYQTARSAGAWKSRVRSVDTSHPAYERDGFIAFLHKSNPFDDANNALVEMGARPIRWR